MAICLKDNMLQIVPKDSNCAFSYCASKLLVFERTTKLSVLIVLGYSKIEL